MVVGRKLEDAVAGLAGILLFGMSSKETTGSGRILVVEDEAIIAADLTETLASLGYDVVATVDTAEDAIVNAANLVPDLVLMDCLLYTSDAADE